ncbi:MAG: hypothetical protein NVS9B7_24350 [Flavisolibacter sp.]
MEKELIITKDKEAQIWQQWESDFSNNPESLAYQIFLVAENKRVLVAIDFDPGGGFENGNPTTTFSCKLHTTPYTLAVHPKNIIDDIGKVFGMEDVVIGYVDFDQKFIIKTNNKEKTQTLFADKDCREILLSIPDFTLETTGREPEQPAEKQLVLNIDEAISDIEVLKKLYHVFFSILKEIEK